MSMDLLLHDLRDEIAALWGAGLATPGPGRAEALRALAETMTGAGLERTAEVLEDLATRLDAAVTGEPSREDLTELHARIQRLTTWEVRFRRAWSLRARRAELVERGSADAAPTARPPGLSGTVVPLGLTEIDGRVLFLARIETTGELLVLHDDWPGERGPDPLRRPQASRLFQQPIVPAEVLRSKWRLDDQPAVRRRGRYTAGPSFFTRPEVLDEPVAREAMPDVVQLRHSADGWSLHPEGGEDPLDVIISDALDFNLRKQAAIGTTLDVRLAPSGDRVSIVAMADPDGAPCFPSVDPGAVVWPTGWLEDVAHRSGDPGVRALADVVRGAPRRIGDGITTFGEAVASWVQGRPAAPRADAVEAAVALAVVGALSETEVEALATSSLPGSPSGFDVARRVLGIRDPGERREFVEAHATATARAARRGEVLPPGRELWLLDALYTRSCADGDARLPVGRDRLRLAAANPLLRAVRGSPGPAPELEDALAIVVGWDEGSRFVR